MLKKKNSKLQKASCISPVSFFFVVQTDITFLIHCLAMINKVKVTTKNNEDCLTITLKWSFKIHRKKIQVSFLLESQGSNFQRGKVNGLFWSSRSHYYKHVVLSDWHSLQNSASPSVANDRVLQEWTNPYLLSNWFHNADFCRIHPQKLQYLRISF